MTAMLPDHKGDYLRSAELNFTHRPWFHLLLLLLWMAIGAGLRFTHLAAKPPWIDEFATLVFSLGHSFTTVPLNQVISLDTLMQPLQVTPQTGTEAVVHHLLTEDVHPPLYFVLAHVWMGLFPAEQGLASLWAARALPALLGVLSIPAMFGLGCLMLRSPLTGHLSAAMMAVSPFGIYLTQEARHYSLGILWVIASLGCFALAVRCLQHHSVLPLWLGLLWIGVNGLGIATHYFFLLTLAAMAIALFGLALSQLRQDRAALLRSPWRRIYAAGFGTAIAGAAWLPILQGIRDRDVTQWIQVDPGFSWRELISPVFQALGTWITMLVLLPVESDQSIVVLAAGLAMAVFLLWAVPLLRRGLQVQLAAELLSRVMSGFVLAAIALFFFITYILGSDITRGARYSFVYFPGMILLLGTSLAAIWNFPALPVSLLLQRAVSAKWRAPFGPLTPKAAVVTILLVSFLSGLTVVNNLGYRKYYRPDLLVPLIQARSQHPILLATTENSLEQIGEMMGLGWQLHQHPGSRSPHFLLAHQKQRICTKDCAATATLQQVIAKSPTPLDVWLINFRAPIALAQQHCLPDAQPRPYTSGYDYQLYRCFGKNFGKN